MGSRRDVIRPATPDKGFTVIGMLGVLVVLGIAATVVYRSLGAASGRLSVTREARRVHGELSTARARALAEQRAYRIAFTAGRTLALQTRNAGAWRGSSRPLSLPEHVTVSIDGSGTGAIEFAPPGRVDAPRTLVVTGSRWADTIRVLASGQVRWGGR